MSQRDSTQRPGRDDTPQEASALDELVDEASLQSFPCSDPPTFTTLHVGIPATPSDEDEPDHATPTSR